MKLGFAIFNQHGAAVHSWHNTSVKALRAALFNMTNKTALTLDEHFPRPGWTLWLVEVEDENDDEPKLLKRVLITTIED
jgi:hypothetical protein